MSHLLHQVLRAYFVQGLPRQSFTGTALCTSEETVEYAGRRLLSYAKDAVNVRSKKHPRIDLNRLQWLDDNRFQLVGFFELYPCECWPRYELQLTFVDDLVFFHRRNYQPSQQAQELQHYNDMSSARISSTQQCDQHSYCPHLHFKKCRKERYTHLPYTSRPIKEIDLTCNVHPKALGHLTTRNIPTLALQKYIDDPVLPDQEDTNFSKNYYLQNCPQKFQLRNTLLRDTEEHLAQHNAYSLAAGATEEYNLFAKKREEYLHNARRRAGVAYNQFKLDQKLQKDSFKAEQTKWITNYFRKVQQLIDHIFSRENNQNQDPNIKDKQFIKEHQGKDAKALGKLKIKDPQSALDILGALRALLLKKKVELQEQRLDQEHNKSVSASYMDASSASNTSQQNLSGVSMISATTNATKAQNEAHFAQRFCDFQKLKEKWGKNSVQEVRNTLRVMLARDLINKAEGSQMRQKKKARERDQFLRKEMEKMGKFKGQTAKYAKGAKSVQREVKQQQDKQVVFFNEPLAKDEQIVKSTLLRGGIFDSVGNIYQRNRNYSKLFRKRGEQSLYELSFRESPPSKQLLTTRTRLQ